MMHHLANVLADKHAKDKNEWMTNNADECFNYTPSNCAPTELKVTSETTEPRKNNISYLGSFI